MTTLQAAPAITSSRQRVLDALAHKQPDQLPVDFGATSVTGIHVSCVAALRDYYGLEKRPVKVHEPFQMLGLLTRTSSRRSGSTSKASSGGRRCSASRIKDWKTWDFNGLEVLVPGMFNITVDENGDTLIYPQGDLTAEPSGRMPRGFHFFDAIIRQHHLDDEHLNVEDNLEEFQPLNEADLATIKADVNCRSCDRPGRDRNLRRHRTGRYRPGARAVPQRPEGNPRRWRVVHVAQEPARLHSRDLRASDRDRSRQPGTDAPAIGNTIDAVFLCGTDFGTQTSAFCSVPTFRELWLPYYKRICDWIHGQTTWKCFKHSCGSVKRFYESFIEAGFDIVNPVQCSATGMEPDLLKQEYGDRLTFWGGGVDTQKTLPFGTPAEVREQVLRRCEIFAPGGGFVFNSIHNIQAGTPVENIVAMFDAVRSSTDGSDANRGNRGVTHGRSAKALRRSLNGDAKTAVAITKEAIAENIDPLKLISGTMVPAMDEVGKRFEGEEYFVPELLLSARAMKASLELLRPLLAERGAKPTGTVAIGTVKGDLHDIGKNLVASLLEGGGFEVIDLGTDVSPEKFIEAIRKKGRRSSASRRCSP